MMTTMASSSSSPSPSPHSIPFNDLLHPRSSSSAPSSSSLSSDNWDFSRYSNFASSPSPSSTSSLASSSSSSSFLYSSSSFPSFPSRSPSLYSIDDDQFHEDISKWSSAFSTSTSSSWASSTLLSWWRWAWGWAFVVPTAAGLGLTFVLSWLVFLPALAFLIFFSLGKRVLACGFVGTSFLLVPLLKAVRYTPGIESSINTAIRWTFIAWFYALVFFEKLLRWILKHFVGHHKDTSRPYSLVNAMDPSFDGFCPLRSASSSSLPVPKRTTPSVKTHPEDLQEAMEHVYNESQRSTEEEQEQEELDQQDIIGQEHEFSNTEYSHPKAYSLALAAKMAYENSDIIKCEVKKWGFTQCRVVRYHNSKAYVASNDEMVLLVFCGTHPLNLRNYITDLQAHLVNAGPLGYVHSGFLEALGLRGVDEEEVEEAEREYKQEWHKDQHRYPKQEHRGRNLKLSLMRGRRRASLSLPVVMRRDRRYFPSKLLCILPQLPTNLWHMMRFVALWHRRQFLRFTGLHDYHEKLTLSSHNAPMYQQVVGILQELGVLQPYSSFASSPSSKKPQPPKRKLWVAGHSLGGALATLFTAQMVLDYPSSEQGIGGIYTYGQPRVGDLQFSQFVNEKVGNCFFRFVNGNDLVPRLPLGIPSWLIRRLLKRVKKEKDGTLIEVPDIKSIRNSLVCYLAGVATNHETSYKHAGQLKYIDYGGNIVEPEKLRHVIYLHLVGLCKFRIFKHIQRDTWLRLGLRFFLPFFMNDHIICDYARAIKDRMGEERQIEEANQNDLLKQSDMLMEEGRIVITNAQLVSIVRSERPEDDTRHDCFTSKGKDCSDGEQEEEVNDSWSHDDDNQECAKEKTSKRSPALRVTAAVVTEADVPMRRCKTSDGTMVKVAPHSTATNLIKRRRWSTNQV